MRIRINVRMYVCMWMRLIWSWSRPSINLVYFSHPEHILSLRHIQTHTYIHTYIQIICDGSLAVFFSHPEHNFDFVVQLFTTSALVAESAGASQQSTAVVRSLAILRLIRACKYFFLRPLWLMLIKMVQSGVQVCACVCVCVCVCDVYVYVSLAILRLNRACKYFFLRPLWLMLIKMVQSGVQICVCVCVCICVCERMCICMCMYI
jgi:hypothetical protein